MREYDVKMWGGFAKAMQGESKVPTAMELAQSAIKSAQDEFQYAPKNSAEEYKHYMALAHIHSNYALRSIASGAMSHGFFSALQSASFASKILRGQTAKSPDALQMAIYSLSLLTVKGMPVITIPAVFESGTTLLTGLMEVELDAPEYYSIKGEVAFLASKREKWIEANGGKEKVQNAIPDGEEISFRLSSLQDLNQIYPDYMKTDQPYKTFLTRAIEGWLTFSETSRNPNLATLAALRAARLSNLMPEENEIRYRAYEEAAKRMDQDIKQEIAVLAYLKRATDTGSTIGALRFLNLDGHIVNRAEAEALIQKAQRITSHI